MRRPDRRYILAVVLLILAASAAFAQFSAETRLVVLHASVVDKRGHLVTNLKENQFKVFENGVQQPIKVFRHEDVPVSIGLLIDDSGSMREKRARVEAAAVGLVKASNPQDEVFIVNFNDEAYLDVPFTSDVHKMEQGLARIDARGGTAMRDAINMSIEYLKTNAKKDKKVLVVITDGNDNASGTSLEHVVQRSIQSEVLIYAVGLLGDEQRHEASKAKRALKELTTATGGIAFFPKQIDEVNSLALEIAHDIRSQYTLAYTPPNPEDGTYRQIKVDVNAPGHPIVRTRTGYYATAAQDTKPTHAPSSGSAGAAQ
jgi:Ca-activated chloride channel family protein